MTYGRLQDIDIARFKNRAAISNEVKERVRQIVENVRTRGIDAVLEYTEQFDRIRLDSKTIRVTRTEIGSAYKKITNNELEVIKESIKRVRAFHLGQKKAIQNIDFETQDGITSLRWLPIPRIGVYAPAGKAPLPSSVIMAAIPAQIAGVKEIILCSPPQKNGEIDPSILVAANECGITEIYKMGGAQAIGALAYGCGLFDGVDLIAGPGNVYTAYAKDFVASEGLVKTDTRAGPSEVVVIADETANPSFVATDMLAQAEHGANSSAICIATSNPVAEMVLAELNEGISLMPKADGIIQSLKQYGAILVAQDTEEAISFVNSFAPEHVEVYTKDAEEIAPLIANAGAVFIQTSEVFGDYGMTGSNHILPTGSAARFSSGVSVYTFMKYQLVEKMSQSAQQALAPKTALFARLEQLEAHANAAEMRGNQNV